MNAEDRLRHMMSAARTDARASDGEWRAFVRRAHRPLYARRVAAVVGSAALVAVGAFAAVALTRDSGGDSPAPPAGSIAPSPQPSYSVVVSAKPPQLTFVIAESAAERWYVTDERLSVVGTNLSGEIPASLAPDGDDASKIAALWLRSLLPDGPGPGAETDGTSAIPEGTRLLKVTRDGATLEVDLSREFESGGGSLSMQLRVGQIVYTGTAVHGIDSVQILIEGERVDAIGGEGFVVSDPLTRRDFQDVAPPIVVESPRRGDEVASGDVVSGFANVFEATVNVRLLDRNGRKLVDAFTTATCGTGCWGDFEYELKFKTDKRQPGMLQVFTLSAEDGSERDEVLIPVTLVP